MHLLKQAISHPKRTMSANLSSLPPFLELVYLLMAWVTLLLSLPRYVPCVCVWVPHTYEYRSVKKTQQTCEDISS